MNEQLLQQLKDNGFESFYFETATEAKAKVLEIIPEGSQVMTMSSTTLETMGLNEILNSDKYHAVRAKLYSGDPDGKSQASLPEFAIGSANAITESGQLVFASASGSQIPAYAFGAKNVVLVISTQKIVPTLDAALKRITDVVFPLENARAQAAYGRPSSINKLLIINKDGTPLRIKVILVNEALGY